MAEGQAVDSNLATATAEPVTGQSVAPETGTVENQNGQATAGQSAPAEESFSNIDPETLPPELKAIYKNLQSDYVKKTQGAAEMRKKAEGYDQITSRPDFKDYWGNLNKQQKADFKEQKQEAEKRLGEKITDEFFQKSFESKDEFLEMIAKVFDAKSEKSQKKIEELEQYKQVTTASNIVESFATEAGPDGKPMRPDFYSLDEDQLISGFLSVNPPGDQSKESYTQRLNEAYSWAKATTQKYYEKGRQEALARIQQKAATSTNPPTQAAKGAYSGPEPKKMSVREAMDLAKKGIRVPTQYD